MEKRNRLQCLNANTLRLLAIVLMVLDHVWGALVGGQDWMHYAGRLAFPIFAFQISEGFLHTHDVKKYARRLFLFALVSEIPFDLMLENMPFYPFHQNVLFTLLFGLLAISVIDKARKQPSGKSFLLAALKVAGLCLLAVVLMVDYGLMGVLTVILFYLCRDFRGARLCQLAGMVMMYVVLYEGRTIPLLGWDFPVEGFGVLALLLIWLYNGEKGKTSRFMQYAAYAFYPVHALVIYGINLIRWA